MQNLLNEPRCSGCPPGTVAKWMDEQARYVKSVSRLSGSLPRGPAFLLRGRRQGAVAAVGLHQDCNL